MGRKIDPPQVQYWAGAQLGHTLEKLEGEDTDLFWVWAASTDEQVPGRDMKHKGLLEVRKAAAGMGRWPATG